MANIPLSKIKGSSPLAALLVIVALAFGLIFYFQIIKPGQISQVDLPPQIQLELQTFQRFRNLKLDFSVFERPEFKDLSIFGQVPVRPSPGGKADLFSQ